MNGLCKVFGNLFVYATQNIQFDTDTHIRTIVKQWEIERQKGLEGKCVN